MRIALFLSASLFLTAACGARSTGVDSDIVPPAPPPVAVDLFVADGAGCVSKPPLDTAIDVITPGDGEAIAVVDIHEAEECTGAGGQYILAHEIDGFRYFWLGGHACYFLENLLPVGLVYGVVRYRQTAAIFQIPEGVCVSWPGEPEGLQTDASTSAIALFERLDEAKAFAASL